MMVPELSGDEDGTEEIEGDGEAVERRLEVDDGRGGQLRIWLRAEHEQAYSGGCNGINEGFNFR